MKSGNECFKNLVKTRMGWVTQAVEAQVKLQPHMKAISALTHALQGTLHVSYGERLILGFNAKDMKKTVAPILEAVEEITGDSFNQTADCAEEWGASRIFEMKDLPISVCISLPMEGTEGCRRVQVGVKEVPIYELRCDDDSEPQTTD
jgi:hypothetical protein